MNIDKFTIPHILENSFKLYSERTAVSGINKNPLTYNDLKLNVFAVSELLKKLSISKGDKVAILGENNPNWAISYFAITSMGAVAVPIMYEFNLVEIHHILIHSESKVIFIAPKYLDKVRDVNSDFLQNIISLDDYSEIPLQREKQILKATIEKGKQELQRIKEAALKLTGFLKEEVNEDDVASLLYTSGTTGHSKGVLLTHKNVVSNAASITQVVKVGFEDRMLSILPLAHTMESTLGLITPIMNGASVYYLEKPPAAASLLPALKEVKPTIMLSVPLIIEKIYKTRILPKFQNSRLLSNLIKVPALRKKLYAAAGKKLLDTFGGKLRMFCIGGAPLSEEVEKFLAEAKFPYTVGFGLTETSPLATGNLPEDFRFRSTGKPIPGVEVKLINTDPQTGEGEICIKGPNVMQGYFRNPEKTNEVLGNDGWFRTGDLGFIDADGYLFIRGRIKNVIIGPNGKNIYPEEIESIINEFNYVVESLVLKKENQLVAKVHLDYQELDSIYSTRKFIESEIRSEIKKLLDNIKQSVNDRVSSFAQITKIFEQEIPFEKTPTRKIKRYLYS